MRRTRSIPILLFLAILLGVGTISIDLAMLHGSVVGMAWDTMAGIVMPDKKPLHQSASLPYHAGPSLHFTTKNGAFFREGTQLEIFCKVATSNNATGFSIAHKNPVQQWEEFGDIDRAQETNYAVAHASYSPTAAGLHAIRCSTGTTSVEGSVLVLPLSSEANL